MDIINCLFELVAGIVLSYNVYCLYRDKRVMGVSLLGGIFFLVYGIWSCLFYLVLGQWFSFYVGCYVVMVNLAWSWLGVYYKYFGMGGE
jgi:hypothetical protein